ncbi:MAG: hypothetical protein WCW29_04365 [Candidatus Paceibacterota bacterium]|jgi:uncharacterized membrane protein
MKKPIIFVQGEKKFYAPGTHIQNIILKALSEGITDPNELKKIAGLRTAAEVYRSLDKLAIRKEYHEALARNGISLDYIVDGIKKIIEDGSSEKVKLGALQTLLESLGLKKYEQQEESAKGWETVVLKALEKEQQDKGSAKEIIEGEEVVNGEFEEYKVIVPEEPKEETDRREEEDKLGRELYAK